MTEQNNDGYIVRCFTEDGRELSSDCTESKECYAKSFINRQMRVFQVRKNTHGLFNPYSDIMGADVTFTKVKEEAINNYLHFLKTRNSTFLTNAERVI